MSQLPDEAPDRPEAFSATPQPPPWPPAPPPYYGHTAPRPGPGNALGIASLALGMIALAFCWFPFGGLLLGGCALGTGIAARRRVKRGQATNNGVAVAGIALGSLASLVGAAIVTVFLVVEFNYQDCISHAVGRAAYARC